MAGAGNSVNAQSTGVQTFTSTTGAWTGSTVTQYAVLLGDASNAVTNVSGVGTANQVLTSNGAGMAPTWQDSGGGDVSGPGSSTDNALARWNGTGGDTLQDSTVIVTDNGEMTNASQPAFLAYNSATDSNVTGDGTTYTLIFDTEVFDQGGDFDGTSTFTAPIDGRYMISGEVLAIDLSSSHTNGDTVFVTSNRQFRSNACSPYAVRTSGNQWGSNMAILADMDAADTVTYRINVSGSSKTIDIYGDSQARTCFSAYLVC